MIYLSYIVYNKAIKDNLIGSVLYLYKNEEEEKCHFWDLFPTFANPQTNLLNTHFYFDIVRSLNTKQLDNIFCIIWFIINQ